MTNYRLFVGVDIAAQSAEIAYRESSQHPVRQLSIQQTSSDIEHLVQHLTAQGAAADILVAMEATGVYWVRLATALHEAGMAVSVLNPSQIKGFAKAQLRRAKTDVLDATLIAEFAMRMSPPLWTPNDPICQEIIAVLARRDQVLDMQTQERNRLHALQQLPTPSAAILADLTDSIQRLHALVLAYEQRLADLLQHISHCTKPLNIYSLFPVLGSLPPPRCLPIPTTSPVVPPPNKPPPMPDWFPIPNSLALRYVPLLPFRVDTHACAVPCTWRLSLLFAGILPSKPSTNACSKRASVPKWLFAPLLANSFISLGLA